MQLCRMHKQTQRCQQNTYHQPKMCVIKNYVRIKGIGERWRLCCACHGSHLFSHRHVFQAASNFGTLEVLVPNFQWCQQHQDSCWKQQTLPVKRTRAALDIHLCTALSEQTLTPCLPSPSGSVLIQPWES